MVSKNLPLFLVWFQNYFEAVNLPFQLIETTLLESEGVSMDQLFDESDSPIKKLNFDLYENIYFCIKYIYGYFKFA